MFNQSFIVYFCYVTGIGIHSMSSMSDEINAMEKNEERKENRKVWDVMHFKKDHLGSTSDLSKDLKQRDKLKSVFFSIWSISLLFIKYVGSACFCIKLLGHGD